MTTKNSAGLWPTVARPGLLDAGSHRTGGLGLAAAALLSLCVAGPAVAQDANQLGLCSLSAAAVTALENDVADDATGLDIDSEDVEVAFVVVYSLNNDNHGQPVDGAFTGPVLCSNPGVTGAPVGTSADTQIPEEGAVDILDSAEAFLLRYAQSETEALPETRFCHTTNANVDCFLLGPTE